MKVIKKLCGFIIMLGYLIILGSVGAEEANYIGTAQCILQTILGIIMIGGGISVWHTIA
jgi:hypothetical protein